jgi:3-dehydro-L-gulonate 2-dehydrogenase
VYTHGLARFPRLLETIRNGTVDPLAQPVRGASFGAIERWDAGLGIGNLAAWAAMERAMELAREYGLGAVALARTNHWMRGGTYGWQAADQGLFAMCWTNTFANLPAWGTTAASVGNNPFVLAVPRPNGRNVVLDMAMSQYSWGAIDGYVKRGQQLPFPGGFDDAGELTTDPATIRNNWRGLPIGLWKGSGMAIALDLMAAMLSGGGATYEIPKSALHDHNSSQIFLVIDATRLGDVAAMEATANAVIAHLREAPLVDAGKPARYPGEQTLALREENLRLGVPVDPEIWGKLVKGEL